MAVKHYELCTINHSTECPRYGYWSAMYRAFFSRSLYVDVGTRWTGCGIVYLLLCMVVVTIPLSLRITYNAVAAYQHELIDVLGAIPQLVIKNGHAIANVPMPYMIKNKSGAVVLIVDTTGKITTFSNQYPKLSILITQDQLTYRLLPPGSNTNINENIPTYKYNFATNNDEVITGQDLIQLPIINVAKWILIIMIYPGVIMMYTAIYFFIYLMFAFVAQIISRISLKYPLTYSQTVRLLAVSGTPQMTLFLILLAFDINFSFMGIFLMILLAIYFNFSLIALKSATNKLYPTVTKSN